MSRRSNQVLKSERQYLVELLRDLTPTEWSQPTLCHGWDIGDLAAHLIVREHGGLLARLGIVLPFLQRYHDRAIVKVKSKGKPEMISKLTKTPWWGTHFRLNIIEFYVHNEDILRGGLNRKRQLSAELQVELSRLAPSMLRLKLGQADKRLAITAIDNDSDQVLYSQLTTDGREELTISATSGDFVLLAMGRGLKAKLKLKGTTVARDWFNSSIISD